MCVVRKVCKERGGTGKVRTKVGLFGCKTNFGTYREVRKGGERERSVLQTNSRAEMSPYTVPPFGREGK